MSWMQPTVGDFSEPLTLSRPGTAVEDGQGGLLPSVPMEVATVWAQVDPRSGQEVLAGNGLVATTPLRFRIHYRTDVTTDWLLTWRGRTFQITADPQMEGQSLRQYLILSAVGGPA
jgi:SPP1 family predicted phage head-tail adaptor